MKKIHKYILPAALLLPVAANAEAIDFETESGYTSVEMYDVWEQSPLRTGKITGNCAVIDNPYVDLVNVSTGLPANTSEKVLGAQRSRFGSNRYGVRINLAESDYVAADHTTQYVHVNILKPKSGRVMLIGLGSRDDRPDQDKYVEQFWQMSSNTIEPDAWYDAVFPIHTADGITLRAFVIVPDCESPHDLTEDFLFYVDNLEVNNSGSPRISNEFYAIAGEKATTNITHSSRYTKSISIKVNDGEKETVALTQQNDKLLYQDRTASVFYAKPGDVIAPSFAYSGNAMHGYCFVDWNNNGRFEASVNDNNNPQEELVTFSKFNGKGVDGADISVNNTQMPAFTVPADTKPGMYRMRLKIDWNSIDPMGNPDASNHITSNGGVVVDAMLCIHGDEVLVNDFQLNGEVLTADGQKLNKFATPFGQPFAIKMAPENGFNYGNCSVKIGFNVDGESNVDKYGNPQYVQYEIIRNHFDENGCYTIPAELMRGQEMLVEGQMIADGSFDINDFQYALCFPRDLKLTRNDRIIQSVGFKQGTSTQTISLADNTEKYVFQDRTSDPMLVVSASSVTPKIGYKGNFMHSYVYFDLDANGAFTVEDELVAYSNVGGKNHKGDNGSQSPNDWADAFSAAGIAPGIYRTRFKVDWDDTNPGGRYTGTNDIDDNGGGIVDCLTHIHAVKTPVTGPADDHVGFLLIEGTETAISDTPAQVTYGSPVTVAALTTNKAPVLSLHAVYGYMTDGPSTDKYGVNQWNEADITPQADGTYIIPAEMTMFPVCLTGTFGEPTEVSIAEIGEQGQDIIHNLQGVRVSNPAHGLYIVNGKTQRI